MEPETADTTALIVAAGRGRRAGGETPKQWREIAGAPVLAHSLAAFADHPRIAALVLVVAPEDDARAAALPLPRGTRLVHGGAERSHSVRAGLEGIDTRNVLIHDAARPCVSRAVIDGVLRALDRAPAAAPAVPVTDALWRGLHGEVIGVVPRDDLWRAQTPQGFRTQLIRAAHAELKTPAADDVAAARAAGIAVTITEGDEDNIKITGPGDFARAEAILRARHGHQTG